METMKDSQRTLERIEVLESLPHGHVRVEGERRVLDVGVVVQEAEETAQTSNGVLAVCKHLFEGQF